MQVMWNTLHCSAEWLGDWQKVTLNCRVISQSCFTNSREDTTKPTRGQHTFPFSFVTAALLQLWTSDSSKLFLSVKERIRRSVYRICKICKKQCVSLKKSLTNTKHIPVYHGGTLQWVSSNKMHRLGHSVFKAGLLVRVVPGFKCLGNKPEIYLMTRQRLRKPCKSFLTLNQRQSALCADFEDRLTGLAQQACLGVFVTWLRISSNWRKRCIH